MTRRFRIVPIAKIATITAVVGLSWGGSIPAYAQIAAPITEDKPAAITVAFNQVPIRTALEQLFNSAHVDYSLPSRMPDNFVTLKCTDLPLESVLKMILRLTEDSGLQLTYRLEQGVYKIEPKPLDWVVSVPTPENKLSLYRLPLRYVSADKVVQQMRSFYPPGTFTVTAPDSHTLLVQSTQGQMDELYRFVKLVDTEPESMTILARIIYVSPQANGKKLPGRQKTLQSMMLQTIQDQEVDSEQQSSGDLPQQKVRFRLKVRPQMREDKSFEVTSQWDVSLPLSTLGVTKGNIRVEKHLTTTSRLGANKRVVVGTIDGDQWGGSGFIVLELLVTPS